MKIGILTEIINYHSGARAPLEIAKHLAKRGHQISVYAYKFGVDRKAELDLKNHKIQVKTFQKQYPFLIGRCIAAISLLNSLKKNPPQALLFSGTLPFFLAGKLMRIPIIWMYMGTQFDALLENMIPNQRVPFITKAFNAIVNAYIFLAGFIIYRFSSRLVAISKYAADEGKHLYKRGADMTIYLGATNLLKKHEATIEKNNAIELLTVSRITPYKGFHLVIEAIKAVKTQKNIHLVIAGSQPKQNYVQYLKKIGANFVKIIIDPSDAILSNLYQQSHIYVCADRSLYFGLPIFEAAQFVKPTVALNLGAVHELVAHGKTGFVANNLDEFSYYLQKLIEDENLRNKLGYNALRWSKTFSWEKCAKEWEEIMKKVITLDINHK